MKTIILTAILLSIFISSNAQWWGINKQYSYSTYAYSLSYSSFDSSVYVSGSFVPYGAPVIHQQGGYIAKYDYDGNFQWEKIFYSTYNGVKAINATDSKGNVWVTGFYAGDIEFETDTFGPLSGMFLFKYDPAGNLLFSYNEPRANAYTINIDQFDNVLIAGYFNTSKDTVFYDQVFKKEKFIAKYDEDGNFLWVKYFFSYSNYVNGYAFDICLDEQGNIYSTGAFTQTRSINDSVQIISTGSDDGFIAKYNPDAELQWVKTITGDGSEIPGRIDVSPNGNIYIGGYYTHGFGSAEHYFDTITIIGDSIHFPNFIAKYDSIGNCQWVRIAYGVGLGYLRGLYVDKQEDVFMTGYFGWGIGNTITFGNQTFNSPEGIGMYLAQYDSAGNLKWAGASAGGEGYSEDITGNDNGDLFITGSFLGNWNFGPIAMSGDIEMNEMFLIKLNSNSLDSFNFNIDTTDTVAASLSQIDKNTFLAVYPNPAKRSFTLSFSFGSAQDKSSSVKKELFLTIRNELGRVVYSQTEKNFTRQLVSTINLNKQPGGIYFVEVVCGEERRTKKIIIE